MNEVFGIPADALATALAVALGVSLAVVAVLALRNPIFLKLGLRNIPRRRARSALIVVGLMLATTIIAAALATGDTMSSTIRSYVTQALGPTDVVVSARGIDPESIWNPDAASEQGGWFDDQAFETVRQATQGSPLVDGVAPAIMETVAVQDFTSRQNEPRVALFASDPRALDDYAAIRSGGGEVSLRDLGSHEVYLNADAAEELGASAGDSLLVLAGTRAQQFTAKAIVEFDGAGTEGAALLMPLRRAQLLVGRPGEIEHVLVSNRGDAESGAKLSDEVMELLRPRIGPIGLVSAPVKEDGLEEADAQGSAFLAMFTTFGSFSIAAGILLIFLIFVMLAAERRGELGIARAVGTRRSHLVKMYVFEGFTYDLAAAAVGILLGIAVAYGMVIAMTAALAAFDIKIGFAVTLESAVLAYALGVLLTLVVVTVSAWRVSVLNIATAVRNLPEPPKARRRSGWIFPVLGVVLGILLALAGVSSAQGATFMLGISLVILGMSAIARRLGADDRLAYTAAGLAIVVLWLLPWSVLDHVTEFAWGFDAFLVSGLMIVVGSTWVLMHNATLLLGGINRVFGRIRSLAPVLKLSIAYPLRSLFRTGVTLAMFTLVVFTLVVGTTVSISFMNAWDDTEMFGGGFDVRAVAAPSTPLRNAAVEVPRAAPEVRTIAAQSVLPLEATQTGAGREFASYPVAGFDDAFFARTTYGLSAMADGYRSADEVWRALRTQPNLAVVDAFVAPRRDNFGQGVMPDFQLSGFYVEDGRFAPVPVDVRDPQTGTAIRLTVIGVLKDVVPAGMIGISTSQQTLTEMLGRRARPTAYWLDLRDGADSRAAAAAIESAFLANGAEAEAMAETLEDNLAAQKTFNWIIEGFMGLGLVVGVAALGVISARSVVERRQQIGVLRSIGFQRRMIQAAFLLESSFVALTSIVVGTVLGLILGYNIIADSATQPSWDNLTFTVPWLSLGVIFFVVYVVALLTTLAPALRASRVYPAEALRYQ
jgi:putative ABC transport system permease protein